MLKNMRIFNWTTQQKTRGDTKSMANTIVSTKQLLMLIKLEKVNAVFVFAIFSSK